VNQFLLQDNSTSSATHEEIQFTIEDAQTLVSSIIVTYLSYGIFGTELVVRLPALNVGSAPSHIINSTTGISKTVQAMALALLKSRKQPNFDASMTLARNFKRQTPSNLHEFNFQHYAKTYVFEHLTELPVISCAIPDDLFRLYKRNTIYVKTYQEVIGLAWLVLQPPGNSNITDLLDQIGLEESPYPWPATATVFGNLFRWAIGTGRVHAVQYLLDIYRPIFLDYNSAAQIWGSAHSRGLGGFCKSHWGDEVPSRTEISSHFLGLAPLAYAIKMSQYRVIDLLISDEIIDINESMDLDLWSKPIDIAMEQENTRALKLLLSAELRERLELTLYEAQVLMSQAKELEDGCVAPLLQDYIEARFSEPQLVVGSQTVEERHDIY
jgi:hypothetical protein